jgi:hypothetical protein
VKLHAVAAFAVLSLAAGALGGCDNPKPRQVPPDPMAAPPPPVVVPPPKDGMSAGLPKLPQMAPFTPDRIGAAQDPLNRQPAATSAAEPILIDGFAFDPAARLPGKGVDVVIDGKAYGTVYGAPRQDVAAYFKAPALEASGFAMTLPAATLAKGPHALVLRVIATDGTGYFESPRIAFQVN